MRRFGFDHGSIVYRLRWLAALAALVAAATAGSLLLSGPYSWVADIAIVLFFFAAAWAFGVAGALTAWAVAFGVSALLPPAAGFASETNLANGVRGLTVSLLFGLVFQMGRSLQRRKAALAASELRFRRLAEASFEGLVITEEGKIVEANDHVGALLQTPRDAIIGQPLGEIIEDERARQIVQQARTTPMEVSLRRRDGSSFDAELIARRLPRDTATMHAIAIRDITERKKFEETLRRNERLGALGTLVAGVAHEINNPLTYIKGNVELMQLDAQDIAASTPAARAPAETLVRRATVALEGLDRIVEITKSLRRVARAPGRVRAAEDVNRLVANVAQVASGRIPPGVALDLDLKATRLVVVNGSEIVQVVLNLLFNAAEAVGAQGKIVLRTYDEGGWVVLEVVDDGPGIPPEHAGSLFIPFFTTKPQGTGLGLPVSQSIAKDHGGDLTFSSTVGEGTTFRLTLPVEAAA